MKSMYYQWLLEYWPMLDALHHALHPLIGGC
jgi:hypothetical protein